MATQLDIDIVAWQALASQLAVLKEQEMEARNKVYKAAFADPKEGVNTFELGKGYELKATRKLNYNLSNSDATDNATDTALEYIENLGNEGAFIAERLVTYKPSLAVSEYKKLDMTNPTHKKIKEAIDVALTISDGSPTLEVKVPKSVK